MEKKKLFISCPMKDKSEDEIKQIMSNLHKIAETVFEQELEVIDSYITEIPPNDCNKDLWYLGKSILLLAKADYFIGVDKLVNNLGCMSERSIAIRYNMNCHFVPSEMVM